MQAALAIFLVAFVATQLFTARTIFWWAARLLEAADIACCVGWRVAVLFLHRWLRDVRVMLATRKEEAA